MGRPSSLPPFFPFPLSPLPFHSLLMMHVDARGFDIAPLLQLCCVVVVLDMVVGSMGADWIIAWTCGPRDTCGHGQGRIDSIASMSDHFI